MILYKLTYSFNDDNIILAAYSLYECSLSEYEKMKIASVGFICIDSEYVVDLYYEHSDKYFIRDCKMIKKELRIKRVKALINEII